MKVYNKKTDKDIPIDSVFVGRPTKWGNPYRMNDPLLPKGLSLYGKRLMVIEAYRRYILRNPKLLSQLSELKGKSLVCWCAPLPCHADILIVLAN